MDVEWDPKEEKSLNSGLFSGPFTSPAPSHCLRPRILFYNAWLPYKAVGKVKQNGICGWNISKFLYKKKDGFKWCFNHGPWFCTIVWCWKTLYRIYCRAFHSTSPWALSKSGKFALRFFFQSTYSRTSTNEMKITVLVGVWWWSWHCEGKENVYQPFIDP